MRARAVRMARGHAAQPIGLGVTVKSCMGLRVAWIAACICCAYDAPWTVLKEPLAVTCTRLFIAVVQRCLSN